MWPSSWRRWGPHWNIHVSSIDSHLTRYSRKTHFFLLWATRRGTLQISRFWWKRSRIMAICEKMFLGSLTVRWGSGNVENVENWEKCQKQQVYVCSASVWAESIIDRLIVESDSDFKSIKMKFTSKAHFKTAMLIEHKQTNTTNTRQEPGGQTSRAAQAWWPGAAPGFRHQLFLVPTNELLMTPPSKSIPYMCT